MKYDHLVSDDLYYWLKYVDRDENYFWNMADKFRVSRTWSIKEGNWFKINLDGSISSYGKVHLTSDQINFLIQEKNNLN